LSEYQYYEFQAIDRPLDAAAQRALRQLSSRAAITDRSFVNEYQWGDFRGDPRQLMRKWFDLFIYWANWGTRTVMLRVPRRYLDPKDLEAYAVEDTVDLWKAGDFTLVCFNRPNEEPIDRLSPEESQESADDAPERGASGRQTGLLSRMACRRDGGNH